MTSISRSERDFPPRFRNWSHYSGQPGHHLRGLTKRSNDLDKASVQRYIRRMRVITNDGRD